MNRPLILASASTIRLKLLLAAGLAATAHPARIDEESIRASLEHEEASCTDIADALAEMKAAKLAERFQQSLVLGCDQVLEFDGKAMAKAGSREDARVKLMALRGRTHRLLSAVVLYDSKKPVWRHVATASLTMRNFSDAYLDSYLDRNWPSVADSVGAYKLEAEGLRLFHAIEGDYFTILGLPMLQLVSYLCQRGFLSE